jgi:hypothetical protein
MSKWQKTLIAVLSVLVLLMGLSSALMLHKISGLSDALKSAQNIIDAKEAGIQELNNKLKIADSDLLTKEALNKKYADELAGLESDFKNIVKKYNLELESRDKVIAQLKGKVNGGTTTVVIKEPADSGATGDKPSTQVISYSWQDPAKRFKLTDPDIFTKDNESFEYKQKVAVTGYVYTDPTGELKIRKLTLQEVITDSTGKQVPVDGSNIEVIDNKFEYIKLQPNEKSMWDIWHPRLLVSFDSQLYPGIGVELINLGRYIDYANIGLNTKIAINPTNGLSGLKSSTVGVGLAYQLAPPLLDTNLGLGVGLATPMDNFLGRYIVTVDAIFYLTN